jgi:hypothetical protein
VKKRDQKKPLDDATAGEASARFSLVAPDQRDDDLFEHPSLDVAEALSWLAFGQPWRLKDWIPRLIPDGEIWQVATNAWLSGLCHIEPAFLQPAEISAWLRGELPKNLPALRVRDYEQIENYLRRIGVDNKSDRIDTFNKMESAVSDMRAQILKKKIQLLRALRQGLLETVARRDHEGLLFDRFTLPKSKWILGCDLYLDGYGITSACDVLLDNVTFDSYEIMSVFPNGNLLGAASVETGQDGETASVPAVARGGGGKRPSPLRDPVTSALVRRALDGELSADRKRAYWQVCGDLKRQDFKGVPNEDRFNEWIAPIYDGMKRAKPR